MVKSVQYQHRARAEAAEARSDHNEIRLVRLSGWRGRHGCSILGVVRPGFRIRHPKRSMGPAWIREKGPCPVCSRLRRGARGPEPRGRQPGRWEEGCREGEGQQGEPSCPGHHLRRNPGWVCRTHPRKKNHPPPHRCGPEARRGGSWWRFCLSRSPFSPLRPRSTSHPPLRLQASPRGPSSPCGLRMQRDPPAGRDAPFSSWPCPPSRTLSKYRRI